MNLVVTERLIYALSTPVETTLRQTLAELGWSGEGQILARLCDLEALLQSLELECVPGIGELGLDDVRVFRKKARALTIDAVQNDLLEGESEEIEFKSSLFLDTKKREYNPELRLEECRSESVLFASIKTIAAFMNSEGGKLYVGVRDDGVAVGLQDDIACYPGSKGDFDSFDLFLRASIGKYFLEGDAINAYVKAERVELDSGIIARIAVAARARLTFVKGRSGAELFLRSGNRSVPVPYERIEGYYVLTRIR
jgi:hypothetical protein